MAIKIQKYGWHPPLPDMSRKTFKLCMPTVKLPSSVDMRSSCPPVYDQGQLGSCTANAIGGLAEFLMLKDKQHAFTPSRLFIYYNERSMEGTVNSDAGASISDGMTVVTTLGAPPESEWWYNTAKFAVKASKKVYTDAAKHKVVDKFAVDNTNISEMQTSLAGGFPVVIGFAVYSSFESAQVAETGLVPMPAPGEQLLGGHAVLVVGYDNGTQRFIVRNSWGQWGQAGYFTMPYAYVANPNLTSDCWTSHSIQG